VSTRVLALADKAGGELYATAADVADVVARGEIESPKSRRRKEVSTTARL